MTVGSGVIDKMPVPGTGGLAYAVPVSYRGRSGPPARHVQAVHPTASRWPSLDAELATSLRALDGQQPNPQNEEQP